MTAPMPREELAESTCFVERSKVRELLISSNIDNESTREILADIDALPIYTAADMHGVAQNVLSTSTTEQLAALVDYLESHSDRLTKALSNPNWTPRRSHAEGDRNAFLTAANTLAQALRPAPPSNQGASK